MTHAKTPVPVEAQNLQGKEPAIVDVCRFKATYPAERIDSVRSLLEDKERQMFQISAKLLIFS